MPTATRPIPQLTQEQQERFWSKVDKRGPDECWRWKLKPNSEGYGVFSFSRMQIVAHRISFSISGGSFSEKEPLALHKCDNRICVNPDHLYRGNDYLNSLDRKIRNRGGESKRTGENNGRAKITKDMVIDAINRRSNGESYIKIAKSFGVTKTAVRYAVIGKNWKHLH